MEKSLWELLSSPSKVVLKKNEDRLFKRLISENSVQLDQQEKQGIIQQESGYSKDETGTGTGKRINNELLIAEYL